MLKIVIIDDEKNVRIVIKKLLSLISSDYTIVGEAPSIKESIELITKTDPDIVLLDIQLEDGNGFDLLEQLPKIDFKLIFITAFNEYAIKAFKFNALDYLLKPIDPEELKNAMEKAALNIASNNDLELLLNNLKSNKVSKIKKLVIKTTQKTHFIPINEILYFESDGSYSKIVTVSYAILASKNLKHFQKIVSNDLFIRTHQSFLVSKLHITGIEGNNILLKNDVLIPISVRRKSEIKKVLGL